MRVMKGACLRALVCAVALCAWTSFARANTLTVRFNQTLSSGTNFVYDIELTGGQALSTASTGGSDYWAPDYFSIYDFAGLTSSSWTSGALTAAAWSFSTEGTNSTNPGAATPDGATPNFRADFIGGLYTAPVGPDVLLGQLTLVSQYTARGQAKYISTDSEGLDPSFNVGTTTVAVPLPPAVWAGMSLLGVLGFKGFRRQRMVNADV